MDQIPRNDAQPVESDSLALQVEPIPRPEPQLGITYVLGLRVFQDRPYGLQQEGRNDGFVLPCGA